MRIPLFKKLIPRPEGQGETSWRMYMDARLHLFATMMALYPFTQTSALAKEFKMDARYIKQIANDNGVHKDSETRKKICKENGDNPRSRKAMYFYYHR